MSLLSKAEGHQEPVVRGWGVPELYLLALPLLETRAGERMQRMQGDHRQHKVGSTS